MLLLAPRSSYRVEAYRAAAAALGVELLTASEGAHPLVPGRAPGVRIDLSSPGASHDAVVGAVRGQPIAGIVATDDATTELASRIAATLGIPHNPVSAARTARRKDLARAALAGAGLPVPRFRVVDLEARPAAARAGAAVGYPCVVKPLAMAGSRGVMRADDERSLAACCDRLRSILRDAADPFEARHALVESFLPGAEVALEGLLRAGALQVLAVFDKPDPLDGPFFEERYYVTPSRLDAGLAARVRARSEQACAAYGLREGPVHAEVRVHRGEAWLVELAARTIGGDCARLLRFGTGRGLESLVLEHALGRAPGVEAADGAAGVLMIPTPVAGTLRRVEGVLAARRVEHVEEVVIAVREGYELVPLPEGSSYLGFVFARGPDPARVESALRRAHDELRVVAAPAWKLEPGRVTGA